jgi:hypothetical protein
MTVGQISAVVYDIVFSDDGSLPLKTSCPGQAARITSGVITPAQWGDSLRGWH